MTDLRNMAAALGCLAVIGALPATPALAAAKKIKVGKPVAFAGPATIAQSGAMVLPSGKADFSGVKRVVIPYFQLEVQSKGGKSESSKAFMSKMQNNVSVTYRISGVEPADLQALTDRLYADLVAAFQARGIEVIDRADARARSKNYAKLEAGFQPGPKDFSPAGGGKSVIYAPTGMGVYFVGIENADTRGGGGLGMLGKMAGVGGLVGGFSQAGNALAEVYALTELDAALVGVRLKVAFMDARGFAMNGYTSVSHRAVASVQPVDSQLWIMAPKSLAPKTTSRIQYQLAAPILPAVDPVVGLDDTQSSGSKVNEAAGNLIGGLAGTSSYKVEEYTVRLDRGKFAAGMGDAMAGTQVMLVNRIWEPQAR